MSQCQAITHAGTQCRNKAKDSNSRCHLHQSRQSGGACHLNPAKTGRCVKYDGPDADDCMLGPYGRCRNAEKLAKAYTPKRRSMSPESIAKGKATKATNKMNKEINALMQTDPYSRLMRGGGCHMNPSGYCGQYQGADADGCMKGPKGRCRSAEGLAKAYAPKRQATPAQLAALAKGRATRTKNKEIKQETNQLMAVDPYSRYMRGGGCSMNTQNKYNY